MSGEGKQPNFRRGCLSGLLILILLTSGFVIWWFQVFNKFNPPPELRPYATRESTMALIQSKAPAPAQSTQLSEEDLQFYLASFDSVNTGWRIFEVAWDSTMKTRAPGDDDKFDPLDLDDLGVLFFQTNLYARRALINYLNEHGKSWDEYHWTKRRVVAASGITQKEFTDTVRNFMVRHNFEMSESNASQPVSEDLFKDVREMRGKGIDSTEEALVASYRETLLTKGLHSLIQTDEMFYGESEEED